MPSFAPGRASVGSGLAGSGHQTSGGGHPGCRSILLRYHYYSIVVRQPQSDGTHAEGAPRSWSMVDGAQRRTPTHQIAVVRLYTSTADGRESRPSHQSPASRAIKR